MLNKYRGPEDDSFLVVATRLLEYANKWKKRASEPALSLVPNANNLQLSNQHPSGIPRNIHNVHYIVSRRRSPIFCGRVEELKNLNQAISDGTGNLESSTDCKIYVLTGISGVGKSEICLKLINGLRDRYVLCSQTLK